MRKSIDRINFLFLHKFLNFIRISMKKSVQKNRQYFANRIVKHLAGCFSVICRRLAMPFVGKEQSAVSYTYIAKERLHKRSLGYSSARLLVHSSACSLIHNNIWYLGKTNLSRTSLCHCVRLLTEVITKVLMQGKVFIP